MMDTGLILSNGGAWKDPTAWRAIAHVMRQRKRRKPGTVLGEALCLAFRRFGGTGCRGGKEGWGDLFA
mgnify:FL=1